MKDLIEILWNSSWAKFVHIKGAKSLKLNTRDLEI